MKGIKSGFVHEKYWDNILIKKQFHFDEKCEKPYLLFKEKLSTSPIVMEPDWELAFEFIFDANGYTVEIVLSERRYSSKTKFKHIIMFFSAVMNMLFSNNCSLINIIN